MSPRTACGELLPEGVHSLHRGGGHLPIGGLEYCGAPGELVRLPCPAGRPDAVGGPYCEEHGGRARAEAEARRDWNYLAPESVGDHQAVTDAGAWSLCSINVYVTVQRAQDSRANALPRWVMGLGIGGFLQLERGAYRAELDAIAAGIARWRQQLELDVAAIRAARGGALEWGVALKPRERPTLRIADGSRVERPEQSTSWGELVGNLRYVERAPTDEEMAAAEYPPTPSNRHARRRDAALSRTQ